MAVQKNATCRERNAMRVEWKPQVRVIYTGFMASAVSKYCMFFFCLLLCDVPFVILCDIKSIYCNVIFQFVEIHSLLQFECCSP